VDLQHEVRKKKDLVNRIDNFNDNVQARQRLRNFLNFSVRMPKNHIFCNRSIPNTFAQKGLIELKNGI